MRIIDSSRAAVVAVLSIACACGGGGGGAKNQAPVAAITAPAASAIAFVGAAVTFTGTCTDPDGDTVSGAWAFPGSDLASATITGLGPVDATYAATGSFQATLTCKDAKGSTGTATRDVSIQSTTAVAIRAEAPARIRVGSEWGYGVVVHAVNGSGTTVPVADIPVTVAVQGVTGGLSGTTTAKTDASGAAVFPTTTFAVAAVGSRTLEFTSPTLTSGTADVEVRAAGGYNITLRWVAGDTLKRRQAFDQARLAWEAVIAADVHDVALSQSAGSGCGNRFVNETVDDLLIFVDVTAIDGPGNILGSSGPCLVRLPTDPSPVIPVVGEMKFDSADMDTMETAGTLRAVVMHEMAHVLGFGTIWTDKSLLNTSSASDPYFIGTNANAHLAADNDGAHYGGMKVPVEATGGTGTALAHWRETVFRSELMTGWLSGTSQPLSATTIGSLQDLGYSVDYSMADAFDLASPGSLRALEAGPAFDLSNDVLSTPVQFVDDSAP